MPEVSWNTTGELDILDGSPPCQGFSAAGKRILDDPRNQLFREYVRLLRGLQPKAFVMENVSGMVKGKMKLIFAEILRELKASGYQVRAWLMNAMYFNVPQSRQRLIFIGVRDDLGIVPQELKPQSSIVTVRQAIRNIPNDSPSVSIISENNTIARAMKACLPGKSLGASLKIPKYYSWVKADYNRPCMTINKQLGYGGFSVWHPEKNRCMNGREIARLTSFPDNFSFNGNHKDWNFVIGNSVPPLFMRAIALHIRQTILE